MGDSISILERLPKVDLHVHLDGSIKPETVLDLSIEEDVSLPSNNITDLRNLLGIHGSCISLREYLSKFELVSKLLHSERALERVAFEIVEQASAQNCKYIEVRFAPQQHREKGLRIDEVLQAVIRGLKRGNETFDVKARVIACCMRHHSIKQNMEVIEVASHFLHKGLVAVDLAGDEAEYPAYLHLEVFQYANKKGIPVTIHAGEAGGPENIYDAVTKLCANRIGHGVRLRENQKIYDFIRDQKIPLEMCPISNIQTKASKSWSDYPLKEYYEKGINITINTDNLTVSNTNLVKEYKIIMEKYKFTLKDISNFILNGLQASFLPEGEKKMLTDKYREEFLKVGLY
ncbi:adenosine deaminase [Evansella sp. AB-rgal1]|uniref:adenosine deaminase n=1 Tax=Evansella sp. AB-rgal1 TaxID=3242696 RepID=UPI00359EA001